MLPAMSLLATAAVYELQQYCREAPQEGATALSAGEAARLVGTGAADRNGRGNVNVGDGGVAFVLAAAAGTPGGPDTVCCMGFPAASQSCVYEFTMQQN